MKLSTWSCLEIKSRTNSGNIKNDNKSSENVEGFKYSGTTLMTQNAFQKEIKSRMESGNACYHSVQNLLSCSLLSKNIKMKIYRKYNLACCFVWVWNVVAHIEGKRHRLSVFENRVLRRIFGPKRDEVTGDGRKLYNEELYDVYCSPNIVRVIKWRRMRWAGHVARMGRGEVYTRFWWGNLR